MSAFVQKNGFKRIAFPLLSGEHHVYPRDFVLEYARETFETFDSDDLEVYLILREGN